MGREYPADASLVAPSGARAKLLFPRAGLRGLIAYAVYRDTRGAKLADSERFSFYPASPFSAISCVLEGEVHIVDAGGRTAGGPVGSRFVSGPTKGPVTSWSPGPALTMSVCFFPDAWSEISGQDPGETIDAFLPFEGHIPDDLAGRLADAAQGRDCELIFARIEDALEAHWKEARFGSLAPPWLTDWLRGVAVQAAFSGAGKSVRQIQRRMKTWTGKTQRDLQGHARLEQAFVRGVKAPVGSIAELALEVGYSDQSHMGREIKRLTGYSPARLRELIFSDERFWFYKLMGEAY